MEDIIKVIFWVIGIVIYFVYQNRKSFTENRPKQQQREPQQPSGQPVADPFEEMLREVAKQWETKETGKPVQRNTPRPMPKPVERKPAYRGELVVNEDSKDYETEHQREMRRIKDQIAEVGKQNTEPITEQGLAGSELDFKKTKVYEKQDIPNRYKELMKNPQTVRDAIVLGEVINKKW